MTDLYVRAARALGDFSSPFYAEERHRDVWNEACAFGLQLLLALTMVAATATVWLVGAPSVPYVAGAVGLVGAVSLAVIEYVRRLGVDPSSGTRVLRWRLLPFVLLAAGLVAGLVRASELGSSFGSGLAVGGAGALVGLGLLHARRRRG